MFSGRHPEVPRFHQRDEGSQRTVVRVKLPNYPQFPKNLQFPENTLPERPGTGNCLPHFSLHISGNSRRKFATFGASL